MIHFDELDNRVNKSWPAYETALKQNKANYQSFIYPGVNHGFHNDATAVFIRQLSGSVLMCQTSVQFRYPEF